MSHKLPNYLRTYRRRAGLSQDDVAFLLGCRSGTKVSRYERRARKPNLRTVLAYEVIFHAPARELFAGIYEEASRATRKRSQVLITRLSSRKSVGTTVQKLAALKAMSAAAIVTPVRDQ